MKGSIEFIVLNYTKIRDNSIVLHTLSEEYGRRGFIVNIKQKTSMARFLPLNILEGDVVENPKSNLWTLKNISTRTPLSGIRDNMYKNTISLFISEVLFKTLKEDASEDGLFGWCISEIMTLDSLDSLWSNFHIRFLLGLCAALGFRPTFNDIAPFAEDNQDELKAFMSSTFEEAMQIPLSGEKRSAICSDIIRYLEFHTESAINIKSLEILKEIFSTYSP